MTRMAALIEDAAAHGLRIVNVSLAGIDRAPWLPFLEAARRHPEILFVVAAGNHGLDIDRQPVYPAAFDLDNMLVVTAADEGGRLSAGANWGVRSVDLMVPAQDLPALDVDGRRRPVSGSSFAAARVSALATCLLAAEPDWRTEQLKGALFANVVRADAATAQGFIPNTALGQHGACGQAIAQLGPGVVPGDGVAEPH